MKREYREGLLKGVVLGAWFREREIEGGWERMRERMADRQTFRQVDYVSAHFAGTN